MSKKTNVRRITHEEDRILQAVRSQGSMQMYSDLMALLKTQENTPPASLVSLSEALFHYTIRGVGELLSEGYMDKETLSEFKNAVMTGKSIIITGAKGAGKSSFLRSMIKLLREDTDINIGLLDSRRDMALSSLIDRKRVKDIPVDGLKAVDLMSSLASDEVDVGVLSEVSTIADIFIVTSSIMNGTPVLMSMTYDISDGVCASEQVVSFLESKVKRLKSTGVFRLKSDDVVVFNCSAENNKYTVKKGTFDHDKVVTLQV